VVARSRQNKEALVKRPLAAAVAAIIALTVLAAPAAALTPTQRIAKLERLVNTQQKTIKKLQKDVKSANEVGAASLLFGICGAAITADALQSTWSTVNQVAGHVVIGTQSPVGDAAVCSRLQVSRPAQVPPTIGPFEQLMRLVTSSTAARLSFSVFG
jgi:hypothetical protein